jgi:biotin carboxyl carrier protein
MATKYITLVDGLEIEVVIHPDGSVEVDGEHIDVDLQHIMGNTVYSMLMDGRSHEVYATIEDGSWRILLDGERYEVTVEDQRTRMLKVLGGPDKKLVGDVQVKAPMPGLVTKILVEPGQAIATHAPLIILEAMKMENELRAPRAGVIKEIRVSPNQTVDLQQVLLILGEES